MSFNTGVHKFVESLAGKIVLYGTAIAIIFTGGVWADKWIDPKIATEAEVMNIDAASMNKHMVEIGEMPYAMLHDVNHVYNAMQDEKIKDAENEIERIDDLEMDGLATRADKKAKRRLERDIEGYVSSCLADHDAENHCKRNQ